MLDIIIPCFAESKYLKRMLESIEKKIPEQDQIHIYIVDDCSKYGEEYKNLINNWKYNNITYLKTEKNSGPGVARNLGLKNSQNDFICFWDDDDIIIDNPIKYCDNNYDLIITTWDFTNDNIISPDSYINPVHGIIFSKNFLIKNFLKFPEIKYGAEDSIFRALMFVIADNIKYIEHTFYQHIPRENSFFTQIYNLKTYSIKDKTVTEELLLEPLCWLTQFINILEQYLYLINNFEKFKHLYQIMKLNFNLFYNNINWNNNTDIIPHITINNIIIIFIYIINKTFKNFDFQLIKDNSTFKYFIIFSLRYGKILSNNFLTVFAESFFLQITNLDKILFKELYPIINMTIETTNLKLYDIHSILNIYNNFYYKQQVIKRRNQKQKGENKNE